MNRSTFLSTLLVGTVGVAGVLLVLFAWHLPPFASALPTTENAYLRGRVTTLSPQLSGYIREVRVQDFQEVHAGDVIAVIDDRIYQQKLAQAEAGLASAEAAMHVAEQNVRSAEATLGANEAAVVAANLSVATAQSANDRASGLLERGVTTTSATEQAALQLQNALSTQTQAQASRDVQREQIANARAQIASAQAQIDTATAAVELARLDLANTEIHAPSDGHLGQVSVRVGQYVSPGTALVSHVGEDVWLVANFNEGAMNSLSIGQPVKFSVDALAGQTFTGRIEGFSPATASEFSLVSGTNATGNFTKIPQRVPVRITIDPNQPRAESLVPGLSVNVKVQPQ
ncbi:Secretion protein HlyD family protein (plasmid) [Ketogulonicigenium robustum]|uniref:Secretion protein HlyD family protein n=1 Tax=Ketogulonicigenium robustum TaxID=92947 RepID=A0A1W6P3B2_9RHOB|nr:HlyD family secretion protein [Ketogulonicigenium robustum]ARO15840.1 Secretion protein HlyD family protein [Ketogulonicigenium robustum]